MRISDWSSDVCSSDLSYALGQRRNVRCPNSALFPDSASGDGMKRTHLPLNGLRVLDPAARHLSFTRAADELAVTPAAVGKQLRALEELLGVVLLRRTPKWFERVAEKRPGQGAVGPGVCAIGKGGRSRHKLG